MDGETVHIGALKNHASFAGGQTARLIDGEHISREVLKAFLNHVPINHLAPVFHPLDRPGIAMHQPQKHMLSLVSLRPIDWRRMFELHVERLFEEGKISNELREQCANSQDHSMLVARTIYANKSDLKPSRNHARAFLKARRDAEATADLLNTEVNPEPSQRCRMRIVDSSDSE